ncbi:MAG: hypothetical protein ACJART_000424 [Maribacter sp.]|jgi:hypothetical protein
MRNLLQLLFLLPFFVISQESDTIKNKGTFSGQWRTYYMSTLNTGSLKDFSALATGGKIKYQFKLNNRFEIGVAVYNSTNLGIQDLTKADVSTGRISRYEEGLFDRLDLANDAVILLGELYASYTLQNHEFKVGRMKINTPLINPQDGRMIPTLVQGFWYKFKINQSNLLQIGVLNQIAPRSTGKYFGIGESIGTYPVGRNSAGGSSQYFGNTISDYIVVLNSNLKITDKLQINLWNQYVDNISNSFYLKPNLELNQSVSVAMEWLHQNKVGDGGNALDSLRYFTNNSSDILGLKFDYKWKSSSISLAYNRILPHGQFVSPREWGREDLFSFQKRERSEGTADNHALVFYYNTTVPIVKDKAEIVSILSLGRHWKPSVLDAVLNKYALPDYTHLNLDLFFNFKKLKNLKPELLVTAKVANGDVPNNPNFFFNKVDMVHVDLILNYTF